MPGDFGIRKRLGVQSVGRLKSLLAIPDLIGLQRRMNTNSRRHRYQTGERSGAHFFHDSGSMYFDRFFCDTKIGRNLFVEPAANDVT